MNHHFRHHCRSLYHAGVRCQISLQHCNSTCFGIRIFHRPYHFRIFVDSIFNVFSYRFAGYSRQIQVKQILLGQFLHYRIHTAGLVQVFHVSRACWRQMAKIRRLCRKFIGNIQIQFYTGFMGDRREVQHGIGRTAKRHVYRKGIHKGLFRHYISWPDILFHKLHDLHACMLGKADPLGINRRDRSVASQSHAKGFCQTVHGICCIHSGAGAAGRTNLLLKFRQFFHCHRPCRYASNCLKHGGKASLLSMHMACKHRPARYKDGRNVYPCRRHQKSGYILITVGNTN